MGYITELKSKTKGTRYKAVIKIRKKEIEFFETETFSTRTLAKSWIRKIEDKLEKNPELLSNNKPSLSMSLANAISKYMSEVTDYGRTKKFTLLQIQKFDIADLQLDSLKRSNFGEHAQRRAQGYSNHSFELAPVVGATINFEFQCIKSVLDHADLVWGVEIDILEYEKAVKGLRKARIIGDSEERNRLPTTNELQELTTTSFYEFNYGSHYVGAPMYLLIWLCIYTGRRLNELVRLKIKDYDRDHQKWFIEGIKHPNGSKGNDKWFVVSESAELIIKELLKPKVRKRMLERGGDGQYLVPFRTEAIDKNWRRLRNALGIDGLHFHDLRHEAATRLAEQGKTIPQIQQYTLHDDWNSLKRYVNLDIIRREVLDYPEAIENAANTPIRKIKASK